MLGENRKIPRPLDVVHSGRTTTAESGCSFKSFDKGTKRAPRGGVIIGATSARYMAWKSEMGCTIRVFGYDAVKIGSKIAARYRQSIGDVKDDAMRVPG